MVPVIVGMCVFILRADFPEAQLDFIFPWFVHHYVPGLDCRDVFVAAASAIISTAGDTVLTSGALLGYPPCSKALRPETTDRQHLLATQRIAMLCFTATGLAFGLGMRNLYNLLVFARASLLPVIAATFVCGILWKANVTGAGIDPDRCGELGHAGVPCSSHGGRGNGMPSTLPRCRHLRALVALIISVAADRNPARRPIQDVDGERGTIPAFWLAAGTGPTGGRRQSAENILCPGIVHPGVGAGRPGNRPGRNGPTRPMNMVAMTNQPPRLIQPVAPCADLPYQTPRPPRNHVPKSPSWEMLTRGVPLGPPAGSPWTAPAPSSSPRDGLRRRR